MSPSIYLWHLCIYTALAFLVPIEVSAAAPKDFKELAQLFLNLILLLIPLIAALCLLAFFWGLAKFILAAGDEKERTEGKIFMIWGLLAMFVTVSLWGIVAIFTDTIGVGLFIPLLPTR